MSRRFWFSLGVIVAILLVIYALIVYTWGWGVLFILLFVSGAYVLDIFLREEQEAARKRQTLDQAIREYYAWAPTAPYN